MKTTRFKIVLLASLVAPAHVYFTAHSRPPFASVPRRGSLARTTPIYAIADDEESALRKLGLDEDATYDQITETCEDLKDLYKDDPARVADLEAAMQTVLDIRLRKRMAGTLKANYEGQLSVDDRPVVPKTPIWVHANEFRKKCIELPTPKYALQVFGILGGFSIASWIAPSTAGVCPAALFSFLCISRMPSSSRRSRWSGALTCGGACLLPGTILLINTVSGMGFVYNRGEPPVSDLCALTQTFA